MLNLLPFCKKRARTCCEGKIFLFELYFPNFKRETLFYKNKIITAAEIEKIHILWQLYIYVTSCQNKKLLKKRSF